MIWDNGYIEGTVPSIEVGYHKSINLFKEELLSLNPISSLIFSTSERNIDSFYNLHNLSIDVSFGLELIYQQKMMLRLGQNSYDPVREGDFACG